MKYMMWIIGIDGSGGEYAPSVLVEDPRTKVLGSIEEAKCYLMELEQEGYCAVMGKVSVET